MVQSNKYSKLVIFYFSGTGNAKRSAKWIIDIAKEKGLETKLIDISNHEDTSIQLENDTLLGFCYPTHGFNAPPVVLKFISKFQKSKNRNSVFLLNTRAGMKLYKLFTPGLSGLALIIPAIMMRIKGYRIVGYRPIDLPSNWIPIHPGIRIKVIKSIFKRWKFVTGKFACKIVSGDKVHRGLFDLIQDILISPISIGYYFFGRFMLSKTFIATEQCDNCGICYNSCPVQAIKVVKEKPFWTFKCESCMRCMNHCPKRAIETPHVFTILIWWLAFSYVPWFILQYLYSISELDSKIPIIRSDLFYSILQTICGFILIWLGYKTLHFLMRYHVFNKIIQYTSLTKIKYWRRYKAPKK